MRVMLGSLPRADILGVRMQAAQSSVGKVLSNMAIWPPIEGLRSTSVTCLPVADSLRAASMPAMPPPTTRTSWLTGTSMGSSGSLSGSRWIWALRMRLALAVAATGSMVTHEQCSRMLAICSRYGLRPPSEAALRKVGSCMVGEQAATTARVMPSSLMSFLMRSWPGSEHMYLYSRATATLGCVAAHLVTSSTSTLPPMLVPQ